MKKKQEKITQSEIISEVTEITQTEPVKKEQTKKDNKPIIYRHPFMVSCNCY